MNTKTIEAVRYHDISCGHRVVGHESFCSNLHGHNYRIWFYCRVEGEEPALDQVGRVIDFSVIKERLCRFLEDEWDHKFLMYKSDPVLKMFSELKNHFDSSIQRIVTDSLEVVPFNPTAENMGQYLLDIICPMLLEDLCVGCYKIVVEETRKCSAVIALE